MARRTKQSDLDLNAIERQLRTSDTTMDKKSDEMQNVLRMQKLSIENLDKDNKQILDELDVVQRDLARKEESTTEIRLLQSKIEFYQSEIETEKEQVQELDKQLAEVESQLLNSRKKLKGTEGVQPSILGQIRTLENRLQTANREFNLCLGTNAQYRQGIDHLKQERKFFDVLSVKLSREIQDLKKLTGEVIEKSSQAYESRDEALQKAAILRDKSEKEISLYNTDIKELNRVLEHDRQLRSFMLTKGQERKDISSTQSFNRTKKIDPVEKEGTPEERASKLENLFEKIKAKTGASNLDEAVQKFVQGERENFSFFKYINELNVSIEQMQEKMAEVQTQIQIVNATCATDVKTRNATIVRAKESTLSSEKLVSDLKTERVSLNAQLDGLSQPVEELFAAIGCDRASLVDSLGKNSITRGNLQQFLSLIEQRATELLQLQAKIDARAAQAWAAQEAELREARDREAAAAPTRERDVGSSFRDRELSTLQRESSVPHPHDHVSSDILHSPQDVFDPVATLGPKPPLTSLLGTGPLSPNATVVGPVLPPSTDQVSDYDEGEEEAPLSQADFKSRIKLDDAPSPVPVAAQRMTPKSSSMKKSSNLRVSQKKRTQNL